MFGLLAKTVSRYPGWVLAAWVVLVLGAVPLARNVGEVFTAESSYAPDSVAKDVDDILKNNFSHSSDHTIVLISRSSTSKVGEPVFDEAYARTIATLQALPGVTDLQDYRNTRALRLIARDRSYAVTLIGLQTADFSAAKTLTKQISATLAQEKALTFHLTGGPATEAELEAISGRDARRAELFGLPISLVVLVIAFGTLVASGLPLVVAVISILLSFAALYLLGHLITFPVFTQSIITMIGLATGIDYALLMVNRFREELRKGGQAREATYRTTLTAGRAVAFSGMTVMVALAALLVPPLPYIRYIGLSTMIVLAISVAVSVTALPSLMALLGHRVNWLKLTRDEPGLRSRAFWRRRGERITRYPWLWALASLLVLIALSLPALNMQVAEAADKGLSAQTDTRQAVKALEDVGLGGILKSFDILVDFEGRKGGFFHPSSLRVVSKLGREVGELPLVEGVYSAMAVDTIPKLFLYQYYATQENALNSEVKDLAQNTVSEDGRYALLRVFPVDGLTPNEGKQLHEKIETMLEDLELTAQIGGSHVGQAEWANVLYRSFPLAVGLVYLATFVLLGLAFHSLLIPIKSIILNTLTVSAAFGVITLVFQMGIGATLFGLEKGIGFVDTSAPVFIFAIVFGLSMDYEVFLIARIFESHLKGYQDHDAVVHALGSTGGVITSAAAVMIAVFSIFIFSEVVLIKTLGLGMAVAVFLDATLVRMALVPAVMLMAGKWNWWLPKPMAKLAKRVDLSHD